MSVMVYGWPAVILRPSGVLTVSARALEAQSAMVARVKRMVNECWRL